PAIAATEALYGEMWAQDAAAMYGYAGSSAAASTVTPFGSPPETTNAAGAASQAGTVAQATGTSSSAGVQSTLSQVVSSLPNALQSMAAPVSGTNPFAPGSNTATTGIAGFLNLLDGETGSAFGSLLSSGLSNGFLSGNWVNPASVMPAVTSSFGDIGFLAVAGQSIGGLNPALLQGVTAPSAIGAASHVGSLAGALGSPGLGGSAVSAGVGRATLVGAMSVPQSWAAAAPPGTSAPLMASSSGGWAIAPGAGTETAGVPGMPGMPAMPVGATGGRGFGFAAPRYGFRPTVVAHPPAAG
ncbi:MAG TPA: PPE domain-containing protein, partial [Mycobacterium sp.]|nr:PPE domain-containing protein [Mycobacterium sp.]